jgi:glycosyltransferase involved in cell wall biosynthesis
MNVLLIMTARDLGGAELYVGDLAEALKGTCHFTVALPENAALNSLVVRLSRISRDVPLPLRAPWRLPGAIARLIRLAAAHDIIHLNSSHPASRLGIFLGFALPALGKPVVAVEHRATPVSDVHVPRSIAWALPALFRWSRKRMARIVTVSNESKRILTTCYRLPAGRIDVVHNGIDPAHLASPATDGLNPRAEMGLNDSQPVILVLARLADNKGHRYLVEAAPAILDRFPDARFAFAGIPEGQMSMERQIAAAGLESRFSILGFRPDAGALLRSSTVFVLPSLAEGFPLSVIEALAAGLPVVATRVGGIPEIIEDGRNGFLVPPADAASLARAVIRALELGEVEKARMRKEALDAAAKFSLAETARKMHTLYRSVQAGTSG